VIIHPFPTLCCAKDGAPSMEGRADRNPIELNYICCRTSPTVLRKVNK